MDDRTVEQKLAESEIMVNALMEQLGDERRDRLYRDAAVILAGMIVADTDDNLTYADLRHRARSEAGLLHKEIDAYAEVDAEVSKGER